MKNELSFRYFKISYGIIQHSVVLYVRMSRSLRNLKDFLHEVGVDMRYEPARKLWHCFGP